MKDETDIKNIEPRVLVSCVQIGKLLTSTLDLSQILEHIMLKVSQLVQAQNWSLLLFDELSGCLSFEVVVGIEKEKVSGIKIELGEGIAGLVAQNGEPLFVQDAECDPRVYKKIDQLTGFLTKSIVCLPLKIHGKILGVIEIINVDDFAKFKKRDLPVLSILMDYAAIAIENSQYFSKIQKMSITDEYTGLYNARYLHDILEKLIKQSEEKGHELAVVFMDIDNFKNVVDTYGHLCGSQVLREIGISILSCLAKDDILIKYGGDEYIIILPDRNKKSAKNLVEKILSTIRKSTYLNNEKQPIKLTSSSGIAMFPSDAKNKKDLLLIADNLMYQNKRKSKNGIGIT
jgi:diguanylate cyclase (GGDEF)-like protein